jgi:hypothetical protein
VKLAKKHRIIVAILGLLLISCQEPVDSSPEVELSGLTVCQGWETQGDPILFPVPGVVPSGTTRICACGQLQTDTTVYLQMLWWQGNTPLPPQVQAFGQGQFTGCIEQDSGFEPDTYLVSVHVGKTVLGRLSFSGVDET